MGLMIVADPGSTHCGRRDFAKELIKTAKECGADAVKFQLFKQEDFPHNIELKRDIFIELVGYGNEMEIPVTASPFDVEAMELLYRLPVPFIKFAYSRRTNTSDMAAAIAIGKRIVCSADEMSVHNIPDDAIKLYCEPHYPVPWKTDFEGLFPELFDGYSCHHRSIGPAIEAVHFGATWIEVHMTLNYSECLKTPDGKMALSPGKLEELCRTLKP